MSRHIGTSSLDESHGGLSPPVRALVTDSLRPRDRSLPAALCAIAGEVGLETDEQRTSTTGDGLESVLEPVVTVVTLLEGYARLRLALVDAGDGVAHFTFESSGDRDAAILASDYLHARAYATIAEIPIAERRRLELYRLLSEGSTAIASQFLARHDGCGVAGFVGDEDADFERAEDAPLEEDTADGVDDRFEIRATVAETAGAIGAAAVGASTETRTALRRYSHAVMTALASQSSAVADDVDPRTSAVRVLLEATDQRAVARDEPAYATSAVERSLERARAALETLSETVAADETATDDGAPSPLVRLERATRIPFQHR